MKTPNECINMQDIRTAIDAIDHNIVELIAQRAKYVHKAAEFKTSTTAVKDAERVKAVINSKKQLAEYYDVSSVLIETIYTNMIDFFIEEELKAWKANK